MLFGGSRYVRYIGELTRQCVADPDCGWCIKLFGEMRSAIGVGICYDRNSSTNPSNRISVPSAHHAGTDDGCATLRGRHATVADTTDSRCQAELI
ncbi:MAG TPA: hypothetical protein VL282_09275 [Tepidisphaeraceae bacterium]|nr:hypothetical protein [Tepidisphaeraceae bacterium]